MHRELDYPMEPHFTAEHAEIAEKDLFVFRGVTGPVEDFMFSIRLNPCESVASEFLCSAISAYSAVNVFHE